MKALILDDDLIVQTLVSAMLKNKGYDVLSADSEITLKNLIYDSRPEIQLFLVDLQLGEFSGLDVYNDILKPIYNSKKVIFMSANSKEDAVSLYGIPDDAFFLEKPFKAPDLFELI